MQETCKPLTLIVIYSDDSVLAAGASGLLNSLSNVDRVRVVSELSCLTPEAAATSPDLILIDLTADITVGLIAALRQASPRSRIVLWGRHFSAELTSHMREFDGVWLACRKCSTGEFLETISNIISGNAPAARQSAPAGATRVALTPREAQLVALLAQGLSNKEIGTCLGITEGTVRIYLTKLFVKVGARHRFELAVFGLKNLSCGQASWDGQNGHVAENDSNRARPVLRSLVLVEPKRRLGYSSVASSAA